MLSIQFMLPDFDENGFDNDGYHKVTGTRFGPDGYDVKIGRAHV